MSARDAGFLYLERSHTQLHIGCVAILEGTLRREDLVARIEERLPRLRRYGQRAMHVPLSLGHPSWEDDPEFRVEHHVARWGLPAPGGESELREAVARLFALPLDRERPLWEMHLLEGLADGRTALFQKVHHCMIDGLAGAQLLETLLDAEPKPAPRAALSVRHESELPDARQRFARALGEELATRARGAVSAWRAVTRPARGFGRDGAAPQRGVLGAPARDERAGRRCPGTRRSGRGAPSPSRGSRCAACAASARVTAAA